MSPVSASSVALRGFQRQVDNFERAAADVVGQSTSTSAFEPIDISTEARKSGAASSATQEGGLEGAMIDVRLSKYLAVANLKVVKAADEMERAVADIVR
ncbi:MAG: hypothetical protein QM756_22450 [Polyangiaceae bacterium]